FSTATAFVRPWLKFWRTVLCSTPGRFMVSVFFVLTLSVLSSFVLSLITFPFPSRLRPLYSSFIQRDGVMLDKAPVIRFNAQSDPGLPKPLQICALKRVAFHQTLTTRFTLLFSCMSLSQNQFPLLGDMP